MKMSFSGLKNGLETIFLFTKIVLLNGFMLCKQIFYTNRFVIKVPSTIPFQSYRGKFVSKILSANEIFSCHSRHFPITQDLKLTFKDQS
jgi:hypothetical protein